MMSIVLGEDDAARAFVATRRYCCTAREVAIKQDIRCSAKVVVNLDWSVGAVNT